MGSDSRFFLLLFSVYLFRNLGFGHENLTGLLVFPGWICYYEKSASEHG